MVPGDDWRLMIAEMVGVAERTAAYAEDGHASVSGWAKATCNWSSGETRTMVQTARLLHAIPEAACCGACRCARVSPRRICWPRCSPTRAAPNNSPPLPNCWSVTPTACGSTSSPSSSAAGKHFADADGAHGAHERAHNGRDAHVSITGERVYLDARGGLPAGVVIEEIFERFYRAEFHTDWEAGKATWGERMNPSLLDRSAAQRRFDALLAIFTAAAGSGAIGRFDPLVNIIVDQTTLEHHLARLAGADPDPIDPATVDERRCETSRGHQIDPNDMLAAALTGHVRRVVFDTAGVVIDLGRRARLFTGNSRDAVMLGDRWCLWPGCDQRTGRCQTDHTQPWAAGNGPTSPNNGGPACARHNRWKQHGYRTWRDPTGHWHTYRPDGTEIGPHTNPTATEIRQRKFSSG